MDLRTRIFMILASFKDDKLNLEEALNKIMELINKNNG